MTRYLWVDVSRLQATAVILAVEDGDPRFGEGFSLFRAVRPFLVAEMQPWCERIEGNYGY